MDAILALDLAAGILAIVAFSTERVSSSLGDKDGHFILERLGTLRRALSAVLATAQQHHSSDGVSSSSSDAAALRELAASCIEDSRVLLEDVGNISKGFPRAGTSQPWTDKIARPVSVLYSKLREEKLDRMSRDVTLHVRSIVRCAMQCTLI
jgi:hypothetical protein